jgi:hypothetical protein
MRAKCDYFGKTFNKSSMFFLLLTFALGPKLFKLYHLNLTLNFNGCFNKSYSDVVIIASSHLINRCFRAILLMSHVVNNFEIVICLILLQQQTPLVDIPLRS